MKCPLENAFRLQYYDYIWLQIRNIYKPLSGYSICTNSAISRYLKIYYITHAFFSRFLIGFSSPQLPYWSGLTPPRHSADESLLPKEGGSSQNPEVWVARLLLPLQPLAPEVVFLVFFRRSDEWRKTEVETFLWEIFLMLGNHGARFCLEWKQWNVNNELYVIQSPKDLH